VTLADLGWNGHFADAFEAARASLDDARDRPGLEPARVSLEHTHIYRVLTADGERLARVAGRLRHAASGRADFPAVGDWVALETPAGGGDARIRLVLPRVSRFSRRAAGDVTEEQVVAANIDVVFLVSGLDGDFNPRRIERYLVTAWESGASPVILLNKSDLADDPEAMAREVAELAQGVPVHAISAKQEGALDPVRQYLTRGRTAALLGMSGVGCRLPTRSSARRGCARTCARDSRGRRRAPRSTAPRQRDSHRRPDITSYLWNGGGRPSPTSSQSPRLRFATAARGSPVTLSLRRSPPAYAALARLEVSGSCGANRSPGAPAGRTRRQNENARKIGAKAIRQVLREKDRGR
jgi:hypothetical protein